MDFLLRKRYSYPIAQPYEVTVEKMKSVLGGKWYDLSRNYYGRIDETGEFNFKSKISFSIGVGNSSAIYLKGKITGTGDGSLINTRISPNIGLVVLIYLLPLICINIFFGDDSIMNPAHLRRSGSLRRALLFRHLRTLFPRLGQPDSNSLFAAGHGLTAPAAFQRTFFLFVHRLFDLVAAGF